MLAVLLGVVYRSSELHFVVGWLIESKSRFHKPGTGTGLVPKRLCQQVYPPPPFPTVPNRSNLFPVAWLLEHLLTGKICALIFPLSWYYRNTGTVVSRTFFYGWTQDSPFNGKEVFTVRYIPGSFADLDP
jgi:hypothetical protein